MNVILRNLKSRKGDTDFVRLKLAHMLMIQVSWNVVRAHSQGVTSSVHTRYFLYMTTLRTSEYGSGNLGIKIGLAYFALMLTSFSQN